MKTPVFSNNKKINRHNKYRRIALIGGPSVVLVIGIIVYLVGGRYVSTDDAYIQAAQTQISANVSGQVAKICVRDNDKVDKGDILFKLDDLPFKFIVEETQAKLSEVQLKIIALKATYRKQQADLKAAKNTLAYQQREFERQKKLAAFDISSKTQLDQAKLELDNAYQQVTANEQQLANVRASLGDNPHIDVGKHPTVQQAQARLNQAELNLSYTVIKAPADGVVTKVEQLQVGDYISVGMPVFSLVSDEAIWVEANFKETELTYMQPGQAATITIDMYPEKKFIGSVTSISPGTGSSFSLLPPENATGNWVKVVQRIPVRISINQEKSLPLRSGSSVLVEVDTQHKRLSRISR